MHDAGFERQAKRLGVHMRHHQNFRRRVLNSDAGDQAVRIKLRRENAAFFQSLFGGWRREGC